MPSLSDQPIPGGWTEREVRVGPHTFRMLLPADPDELLNHLIADEVSAAQQPHLADPYWSKLWPAAPLLAEAVTRNPAGGVQVLELGCGSGLVGLAALACGWEVTFSDYVPQAVELALENAARNAFTRARGLVLDWHKPLDQQFDLILAADVTYDHTHAEPLLGVLDRMLATGGQAWFGDAGRSGAATLLKLALDRGWSVDLFDEHDRPACTLDLGHYRRLVLRRMT